MTDSQLLESYLGTGRLEYFGELYNRYLPLVYGLCLKYMGNVEIAEDAVMEIFEEIIPKMEKAEVREFRTWIYSVARNHCLQLLRKKKIEVAIGYDPGIVESDTILHLLDRQDDEELLEALESCMGELPEPQRRSIRLFFMEQKSYADICELTDYSLKSVKSYIQNGKRNLRNCIEAKGVLTR